MTDTATRPAAPRRTRGLARRMAVVALAGAGLLAGLAPTAATAAPAGPNSTTGHGSTATDPAALRRALDAVVGPGGSSAVQVEVRQDGRTAFRGAAGVADRVTGAPVPENARFRIGSVTKTFAATVVLQLVGEQRLGLDDPVERHLPGLVPNGAAITVRHLLNHTSGLYNFTDDPRFGAAEEDLDRWLAVGRWTTYRPVDVVRIATARPARNPGTWGYSNTNYVLLGMIIERVTGRTWVAEVERRIVQPLGLHDTSMPVTSPFIPGPHARGYQERPSGAADVTLLNPSAFGPAGAGISTTRDLVRFNQALLDGRLLRPAQLAAMKQQTDAGEAGTYGLGLARYTTPCGEFWGLTGGIPGYGTVVMGTADGHRQLAVSLNPYHLTAATGETLDALVDTAACGARTAEPAS
ncbi:serine hydrolase domain-containing protein [Kitasatospora sp. NPDC054939]